MLRLRFESTPNLVFTFCLDESRELKAQDYSYSCRLYRALGDIYDSLSLMALDAVEVSHTHHPAAAVEGETYFEMTIRTEVLTAAAKRRVYAACHEAITGWLDLYVVDLDVLPDPNARNEQMFVFTSSTPTKEQ